MKKPKLFEYETALRDAHDTAARQLQRQTFDEAKEAFREHWGLAALSLQTLLLRADDEATHRAALQRVLGLVEILPHRAADTPAAGGFVFAAAQSLCRAVMGLAQAQPPPAWLAELAAKEYEVPWLMVNGKPAPGFAEADAALAWGRNVTKRGKNRFDAPKTRAVAEALHSITWQREHPDFAELLPAMIGDDLLQFVPFLRREYKRLAALPTLSRKTAAQWWPEVRAFMQRNAELPEAKAGRIVFKKDTPAARREAFWKDCKKAFYALCPADAPGDESGDLSPNAMRCPKSPDARRCPHNKAAIGPRKKQRGHDEGTGNRSVEKPAESRGGKPRRSPRNHGGRNRGKGRPR